MAINYHNIEQELNKADYIVRIIAFLIDTVILGSFTLIVNLLMVVSSYLTSGAIFWGSVGFHTSLMLLIVFISCVLYSVISVCVCGATIGKYLMRIEVVTIQGRELTLKQIICREFIGRTLCKLSLFSGFAMMFYNEEGFGFHDKIAGTMVVKKGEDLMELAVGKEILKKALLENSDEERYNRIYNRGINAKLSGGGRTNGEQYQPQESVSVPGESMGLHVPQFPEHLGVPQQVVTPQHVEGNMSQMGYYQEQYQMPAQELPFLQEIPQGEMYGFVEQQVMPMDGYGMIPEQVVSVEQQMFMEQAHEMVSYQEALQNVVDEHSLMDECQQQLQFHT